MESLFYKECIYYEKDIDDAMKEFNSSIVYFNFDLMLESPEVDSKTSRVKVALITLIQSIKAAVENFIKGARKRIESIISGAKFKSDLNKIRKAVKKGKSTVEFYDVWEFEKVFKKASNDLSKKCISIQSKCENGCTIIEAEIKLKSLRNAIDRYNTSLNKIKETKITVDSTKLLSWLESNYTDTGKPLGMMYIYKENLDRAEKTLNELQERTNKYYKDNDIDPALNTYSKAMRVVSVFYKENSNWILTKTCSSLASVFADILEESDKDDIANNLDGSEEEKKEEAKKKYEDPEYKSRKKNVAKTLKTTSKIGNQISDIIRSNKDGSGLEI